MENESLRAQLYIIYRRLMRQGFYAHWFVILMQKAASKFCISDKVGFKTREEAEKSGQRAYKCPYCKYYHRTGAVRSIHNPVIVS